VATTSSNGTTEMFGQAAKSFETAIQTGLKLQEESVKCVAEMLSEIGSPQKWQKKAQEVMQEMISTSQRNLDEAVQAMNENAKTSLMIIQKAVENRPTDPGEAQSKTLELWETTLGMLRRNTETALRANGRLVEAWTEMAKKVNGEQMERMAQMAQKATKAAGVG
jgi:hypothetical protein